MKTLSFQFVLSGMLIIATTAADAQSGRSDGSRDRKHEEIGKRIATIVEDVIDRIGKGLSLNRYEKTEDLFSDDSLQKKREKKSPRMVDVETDENSVTFEGDVIVHEKDTISNNIVVKAGDLTVYGIIMGDALVVGGDIYVKDGGRITGNAKVINGDIVREEGGRIDGYIDRTSSKAESYREDEKKFTRSSTRFNASWVSETTNLDNFIFRYNRVEGLFLGLGSEKRYYWDGRKSFSSYGSIGWGFKSHTWRGNLGLSRQFKLYNSDEHSGELFEIGVEGHSLTDSKDQWIIGLAENTAAAFLIHEDYRDYFEREGVTFHTGYYTQQDFTTAQFRIEYNLDKYTSLENRAEWSLFGGDKLFRVNPPIDNGRMRSFVVSPGFSTVTKTSQGPEGWSIYGTVEFAEKSWGSDFTFSQYMLDVRRYQPLGRFDNLNFRLRVGTSEKSLPLQKRFEIGGLGTLNAFPFKSEAGNRLILVNAEYIINGDFLGELDFWPSWFMSGFNFIVLADAGLVRDVSPNATWTDGFGGTKFSHFKHDVGLGISSRSGSFRLAFVWPTDHTEGSRLIFRITRPF